MCIRDRVEDPPDDVIGDLQLSVVLVVRAQDVRGRAEMEHEEQGAEDHGGPEGEVEETLGQASRVLVHHAADDAAELQSTRQWQI